MITLSASGMRRDIPAVAMSFDWCPPIGALIVAGKPPRRGKHTKAGRHASRRAHDRWHASVAGPSAILGARGLRAFLFAHINEVM